MDQNLMNKLEWLKENMPSYFDCLCDQMPELEHDMEAFTTGLQSG